jgi:hypothetical protein
MFLYVKSFNDQHVVITVHFANLNVDCIMQLKLNVRFLTHLYIYVKLRNKV